MYTTKRMKEDFIIHEGFTNNYLIPGVFAIVAGLVLLPTVGVSGLPFLILGIVILTGSNGLEINKAQKKFRKYGSFGGIRIGKWKPLYTPVFGKLILSSENTTSGGVPGMQGFLVPNQGKLKSLTYDVYIKTKKEKWILLYEFLEYDTAKSALGVIENQFQIEVLDKVLDKLLENREKRSRRRR